MNSFGRIIGIDVGLKRIGLARTDPLQTSANAVGTFSPDEILDVIARQEKDFPILGFVVGWPLTESGEESDAIEMVRSFIKKLKNRFPETPVYKIDERYSSRQAVKTLIESGVPKMKRAKKGRIDQAAAALLLQHYLETKDDFE